MEHEHRQNKSSMKLATLRYTLINMTYFAAFCGVHAYASVFLLSKGFTNTQIGISLASANIISVILQPIVAGIIDKKGKLTNRNVSIICSALIVIGSLILYTGQGSYAIIFILYSIIYMLQMLYQPLIIAMYFEYSKKGAQINFGLSRGLGSFGFAITSIFFGRIVTDYGIISVQLIDAFILIASAILLLTFTISSVAPSDKPEKNNTLKEITDRKTDSDKAHNNIFEFIKTYPRFFLFIIGSVCFFFAHNAINDYFIQIITPVGGDEAKMGIAIFIAAALELPTMAGITVLRKKAKTSTLLIISGFFFLIKTLIILFAKSMTGVYISQACQMTAYALFIPASAYNVDEVMSEADKVKGQAYVNVAITLGGVFSNLLCGRILDGSGVTPMLTVASVVCAAGLIIVFGSIRVK